MICMQNCLHKMFRGRISCGHSPLSCSGSLLLPQQVGNSRALRHRREGQPQMQTCCEKAANTPWCPWTSPYYHSLSWTRRAARRVKTNPETRTERKAEIKTERIKA